MNTKLIAVAVVAIVVVAAVAVVIVASGNDDDDGVEITAQLRVFGNADGDYDIDNDDLEIIQDIADGKTSWDASANPLADADCGGSVDSADVELVQKIINGESCTIHNYNTCSTGDYIVETAWPCTSALATGSSNMLWLMTMAGMDDKVHGISYSSSSPPDSTLFPAFSKMTSIGSSSTTMPYESASNYITDYNVDVIIVERTASTVNKTTVEPVYEDAGVDVVRVNPSCVEADDFLTELFMLGFLFQTMDKCVDIAEWWIQMQEYVDSELSSVEAVKAIACNGTYDSAKDRIWISAGNSDYKDLLVHAGATYAFGDSVPAGTYSSGCYFSSTDTWLYNYDIDYIINIKTNDWYSGTVDIVSKYESCVGIFNQTEAYQAQHATVIVGDAPIPIRLAYAAATMYPEVFSEEWADELNQEFFEKFTDLSIDFTNLFFTITYADYVAAGGTAYLIAS